MTALDALRTQLIAIPELLLAPGPAIESAIADSVRYLASDDAARSIATDVYWPKWHSPWWHMLVLFEIGEARRIPERAVIAMVEGLQALPVKTFPIWPGELPAGADPRCDVQCHCALGNMMQILSACGRDVAADLPWFEPWFARYQMADGGLNCDDAAYRVTGECPSSMVGTVPPIEAMLLGDPARWSAERAAFVDRAAGFLIERQVMLGSSTVHNAEERGSAVGWRQLCFPRLYLYDVLRGLAALVRWAEVTGKPLPIGGIAGAVDHLIAAFPDGAVHRGRQSYAGVGSWVRESGAWVRHAVGSPFPLLAATSGLGEPCPYLTRQWSATRRSIVGLIEQRRVVEPA
jgi:hypothetical protein